MAINIGPQGVINDSAQWIGDPAGLQGSQGDKGFQGNTGLQGAKGFQGNTGGKGDKGDTGDKGTKGDTGAQGYKGDKGNTGDKGEKGDPSTVQGDTGEKGDKGNTGDKGDKGNTGDKGDQGDTGAKGDKGDNESSDPTYTTVTLGTQTITETNVDEFKHASDNHLHNTDGITGKLNTSTGWYYRLGAMQIFGGYKFCTGTGSDCQIDFEGVVGTSCANAPVFCDLVPHGDSYATDGGISHFYSYKIIVRGSFGTGRNINWMCICDT